jgi:hypothetical protein
MLLCLVYAVSAIRLNSLHRLLHDEKHAVEHFAENEKDPCHRAIYHKGSTGCEHKAHVSEISKCNYCDISAVPDHVHLPELSINEQPDCPAFFVQLIDRASFAFQLNLSARAPPAA